MGRKRRRSGVEEATSTLVASTSAPAASGAGNGKKQRLGDGKSGKPAKTLKLKLIKAPSASKSVPVAESSKAAGSSNSTAGVAPTAGEGKKKKKKSKKSKAGSAGAAATPTLVPKAKPTDTSAIDDLFASLKTAKQEQARADEQKKRDEAKAAQRAQQEKQQLQAHIKKLEAQNTNSIGQVGVNPDPRPVRYDEDGMPIYTEDSLYIGKGGDTADCPFDCWCCF